MSKVVKRAVVEVVATLGHVKMAVETVPWFDGHVGNRAKRVHFNWRSLELLESAGFGVDSGLSLPARADYDVRTGVIP